MLRAQLAAWFRPATKTTEVLEGRQAYHSDIRAIRPEAWSTRSPAAKGCEVEQALWLAGVSSRDFADLLDIELSPQAVTPVDDIVTSCRQRARECAGRAREIGADLPPPNPYGRPPLPWHRSSARQAQNLHRAARAWEALANALLSNRWTR